MLPADDACWDQGIIAYNDELTVFSPANINMGSFAQFAQATNLLAQVLRHVGEKTPNQRFHAEEAIQLDRTIRSLIVLANTGENVKQTAVCLQTAVCYSALMSLHDPQTSQNFQIQGDWENHSWAVRKAVSDEVCNPFTPNPSSGFLPKTDKVNENSKDDFAIKSFSEQNHAECKVA